MKYNNRTAIVTAFLVFAFAGPAFHACTTNSPGKSSGEEEKSEPASQAEKLGFPAGKKVIILHADDAGMCEEANEAVARMLENDLIQSTAIMVPCPAGEAFIQWAMEHPGEDVGLHLTLTSEWKDYRWGPVSDPDAVPGLVDPDGMMWHEVPQVVQHASAAEVEREIRAQIDRSISLGYRPDHIDTHMGTLYGHPDFVEVFFRVAEEYGIPANVIDLSDSVVAARFLAQGYPINDRVISLAGAYTLPKVDNFTYVPKGDTYEEKISKFRQLIKTLTPGLTEIIFHPSVESANLKQITHSWQQRVWEYEMFADPDLIRFFEEEGIIFTNWKEVMERFNKSNSR